MKNDMYFGYYRMSLESYEAESEKGYLNVFNVPMNPANPEETAHILQSVGERGGKVWLGVWNAVIADVGPIRYFDDWQERLAAMVAYLEKRGVMEHLLGFYLDEPFLWGFTKEDYLSLTRYLRQAWPEKRHLTVFAVNAVDPTVWSSGNDCVPDPETLAYTTDAGFDMYWDARGEGIKPYETLVAALKKRFGREDFYVWYVPCVMNYRGDKDEAYALAHTEAMYDFLKQEKKPGGMLCYAYEIPDHDAPIGNIGFSEMREIGEQPWRRLEARLIEIGKEMIGE